MLISKIVLAMTCGLALATPTLAHEQSASFEYWPVARNLRSGQFQAEVWRHDLRNDSRDLAWTNQEAFATPAIAMAAACTSVQNNFDASFACSRVAYQASNNDRTAASAGSAVVGEKMPVAAVEGKGSAANKPMHPLTKVPVYSGERRAWLKDFWKIAGK
jgi:hypothetical protein